MNRVVNLFGISTEGVADVEKTFDILEGKVSKKELAEDAYTILMTADFKKENKRRASAKAWDIAEFYNLGEDKILAAKEMNLQCEKEYLLNSRRSDVVEIPSGETKESFLKCRIGNMKRIQDLYRTSILKDEMCFAGEIEMELIAVQRKIELVIAQLELMAQLAQLEGSQ